MKVYLLQGGKKVSKKKTSTKRDERNAVFNEAMTFSVPANALQVGLFVYARYNNNITINLKKIIVIDAQKASPVIIIVLNKMNSIMVCFRLLLRNFPLNPSNSYPICNHTL